MSYALNASLNHTRPLVAVHATSDTERDEHLAEDSDRRWVLVEVRSDKGVDGRGQVPALGYTLSHNPRCRLSNGSQYTPQ